MRPRQAHGHVEVVGARRTLEDGHHEARVDRVHHVGDLVLAHQRLHRGPFEASIQVESKTVDGGRLGRAHLVIVGDEDALIEVTPSSNGRKCRSDTTGTDEQDPHRDSPFR